jgi:hypothetical protein
MNSFNDHHETYDESLTSHFSSDLDARAYEINAMIAESQESTYIEFASFLRKRFTTKDLMLFSIGQQLYMPASLETHEYYVAAIATDWVRMENGDPLIYTVNMIRTLANIDDVFERHERDTKEALREEAEEFILRCEVEDDYRENFEY